jgi:hypothetical protein
MLEDEDDKVSLEMSMKEIADYQAEGNETTTSCKGVLAWRHYKLVQNGHQSQKSACINI